MTNANDNSKNQSGFRIGCAVRDLWSLSLSNSRLDLLDLGLDELIDCLIVRLM